MSRAKEFNRLFEQEKEKGRLVRSGMGGFLNPPGHPEHDWSVEKDLKRRSQNRGRISLLAAIKSEWFDDNIKKQVKNLLDKWEESKPPLSDPKIQDWIGQVMKHFKGGYEDKGVEYIKKFYPDFELT